MGRFGAISLDGCARGAQIRIEGPSAMRDYALIEKHLQW
jgi:hypothetical protein